MKGRVFRNDVHHSNTTVDTNSQHMAKHMTYAVLLVHFLLAMPPVL